MRLSDRLEAVISLVTPGNTVLDVGCDHAFVPIELVGRGISPAAAASDLREGPLRSASGHISGRGLEGRICCILADGIPGDFIERLRDEAGYAGGPLTLITAGMGGLLMRDILADAGEALSLFSEYVASPQRNAAEFRRSLRELGFMIVKEKFVEEEGKFYPVICARPEAGGGMRVPGGVRSEEDARRGGGSGEETAEAPEERLHLRCLDEFGPVLVREKNPVLFRYLLRRKAVLEGILAALGRGAPEKRERREEIEDELRLVDYCESLF